MELSLLDLSSPRLLRKSRSSRLGITCRTSGILMVVVRPLYTRLLTMNLKLKSSGVAMNRVHIEIDSTIPSLYKKWKMVPSVFHPRDMCESDQDGEYRETQQKDDVFGDL